MRVEDREGNRSDSEVKPEATATISDGVWLRNAWYVAGWADDLTPAIPVGITLLNQPVACYRDQTGAWVALEDRCAHRWAPLSRGRVEGNDLRCMYHGLRYDRSGRCVEIPGQNRVPKSLGVRRFPALERHGFVWVWMGDPGRADPHLIPDLSLLDDSSRHIYRGSLDYNANYALISDNLLDLSHISFLHERTLGRSVSGPAGPRTKPRVHMGSEAVSLERGVRVENWVSGAAARGIWVPSGAPDGDLWSRVDLLVPGIYVSQAQMYPEGTAEECRGLAPLRIGTDQLPLSDSMSIQAIMPITSRRTRYFYSYGSRSVDMSREESDAVWAIIRDAFTEDLNMIEAQQRNIDQHPGHRMAGIAADRGLTLFRALVKRLASAEISYPEQKAP
jgi:phenylpropionate dioxygenase-like ring-hydroxylating dioxygenase large terminal subunit